MNRIDKAIMYLGDGLSQVDLMIEENDYGKASMETSDLRDVSSRLKDMIKTLKEIEA